MSIQKNAFVFCALVVVAAAAFVTAGPLSPPSGPIAPTGPSLADVSDQVAAVQSAIGVSATTSSAGYSVAGIAAGSLTTSWQNIVTGRSGIIRQIVIASDPGTAGSERGVELQIDGANYAGLYRHVVWVANGGIVNTPIFQTNIRFNTSVQARVREVTNSQHSISIHYIPQ